jgi:hypothetical protein
MSAAFTPGPWTVGTAYPCVHDWTGRIVAECPVSQSDIDAEDDAFANANLIGGAPEMFEALLQYRDDLKRPPEGDSKDRRLERVEKLLAKVMCKRVSA